MEALTLPLLLGLPLGSIVAMSLLHQRPHGRAWVLLLLTLLNGAIVLAAPDINGYPASGWRPPLGIELGLDALTRFFLLVNAVVFTAAAAYHLGQEKNTSKSRRLSYQLAFPVILLSLNGLFLTRDFFNFYVFFELLAIASYLLVAMGKHHPLEAAWKYAVLSILASAMLLAGTAFLYGLSGSLNMSEVQNRLTPGSALWLAPFFLFAFFLKGSIFPFHVWQPDAHAGATTPGSMILAGCLINVGVYGLLRFWPLLFGESLRCVLLFVGATSVLFGGLAAFATTDAKRLLGYSSTSQLGFVLLGLGWGTQAAVSAAIFYLGAHALAKALLFAVTGVLGERSSSTSLLALLGSGLRRPWLNAAYLLGFLSLSGLPPAAGFVGKVSLLQAGVAAQAWPWLAVALLGTIMTLVYGMKAYRHLFWMSGNETSSTATPSVWGALSVAFLALGVLLLFASGRPILRLAQAAASTNFPGGVAQ